MPEARLSAAFLRGLAPGVVTEILPGTWQVQDPEAFTRALAAHVAEGARGPGEVLGQLEALVTGGRLPAAVGRRVLLAYLSRGAEDVPSEPRPRQQRFTFFGPGGTLGEAEANPDPANYFRVVHTPGEAVEALREGELPLLVPPDVLDRPPWGAGGAVEALERARQQQYEDPRAIFPSLPQLWHRAPAPSPSAPAVPPPPPQAFAPERRAPAFSIAAPPRLLSSPSPRGVSGLPLAPRAAGQPGTPVGELGGGGPPVASLTDILEALEAERRRRAVERLRLASLFSPPPVSPF